MWVFAMFDLPVDTKEARRQYTGGAPAPRRPGPPFLFYLERAAEERVAKTPPRPAEYEDPDRRRSHMVGRQLLLNQVFILLHCVTYYNDRGGWPNMLQLVDRILVYASERCVLCGFRTR